ncbi:MAG: cupin domain-containing protein [Chloroflexi bacterium]|nr:cupin domain-containing protein [Chloroflexota bacterium]MCH8223188.1 cupin domain-containing protein [Chloroflexota bacterium]
MADYIDPIDVSPDIYKLLDENDKVRVVEMKLAAGQSDNKHSHRNETVYFVTGGKVKIDVEGGDTVEAEIPDGHVMFSDPWTHTVHNVGDSDIRAILIEEKG